MTKDEKLREIIRRDVERGFFHEVRRQVARNSALVKKLALSPGFMDGLVTELIDLQMPFYSSVSEATVDAAYQFFTSEAGDEWIGLSTKFTLQLGEMSQRFAKDVFRRLTDILNN